jgi:ADP-dependent phosphofructokinase/glucokinase
MMGSLALGFGDNVDYEIEWDSNAIEGLIREFQITDCELVPIRRIRDVKDLTISILGFVKAGRGGECYVGDLGIIREFSRRLRYRISIGGTAPRAAIALSKMGISSAVHLVTINDHIRRLLPQDVSWVCSNDEDSSYPHLIVQFVKGARVTAGDIDITAPASSRIIYVNDLDNDVMRLEPDFFEHLDGVRAFLVSGFNAMHDSDSLHERIGQLAGLLEKVPETATIFYEDACFHEDSFKQIILDKLAERFDIFSLNEDELQDYLKAKIDLLDAHAISKALSRLHDIIPVPTIVVHTSRWTLASGRDCGQYASALEGGIAMATTRFRLGDDFKKEDFVETGLLPKNPEGIAFARELNSLGDGAVYCMPSLRIEEKRVTTVGLGDAFVGGFLSALA